MTVCQQRFLDAVCVHLRGERVDWAQDISRQEWEALFSLAREQHLLPMVVESVCTCPAFQALDGEFAGAVKRECRRHEVGQALATHLVQGLCRDMEGAGLHPVVMKGAVCRAVYPMPDARRSADEDILVPPEEFAAAAAFLLSRGCSRVGAGEGEGEFELSFHTPEGLHLELHKTPFDPHVEPLCRANALFEGVWEDRREMGGVPAMSPHDHMLYLILHAWKHLIHRGFGLRQVCDIALWGSRFRGEIRWEQLRSQCGAVRAWPMVQAVFALAGEYLGLPVPEEVDARGTASRELLEDILSGGVYGGENPGRKHSATVTLTAVQAGHTGKKPTLLPTLFPPRRTMEKRFSYLHGRGVLLPVAWLHRILLYGGQRRERGEGARDSLRIGRARTELLKKLDIMD